MLYVACLVGLIVIYLTVASMQVRVSSYVLGRTTWTAGAQNAVRGTLMDPLSGRRWHDASGIELRLLTPDEAATTPNASPEPAGALLARPKLEGAALFHAEVVPEVPPGSYVLSLRAIAGPSGDLFEARSPVTVAAPAGPGGARPWPAQISRREESHAKDALGVLSSKGPVRLDVMPRRPELPRGLHGEVYLRATDRATGAPLECDVDFDEVTGLSNGAGPPRRVRTNALGLARVRWRPALAYTWELSTACTPPGAEDAAPEGAAPEDAAPSVAPSGAPVDSQVDASAAPEPKKPPRSTSTIHIATVASQTSLMATVSPTRVLEGGLESLRDDGGFFVDLYVEGRWAKASAFGLSPGGSGWSVPAPQVDGVTVARLQTSLDLFFVGNAWDVRHVIVRDVSTSEDDAREEAWELLVARHAATAAAAPESDSNTERLRYWEHLRSDAGRALWGSLDARARRAGVAALLAAIPTRYDAPEALINSQRDDAAAMAEWRDEAREQLILVIALAMLLGVLALGAIVARGIADARVRQALLEQIDLELDDDGDDLAELHLVGRRAQVSSAIQGFVVFGTIVLFALSLLMLLRFL